MRGRHVVARVLGEAVCTVGAAAKELSEELVQVGEEFAGKWGQYLYKGNKGNKGG